MLICHVLKASDQKASASEKCVHNLSESTRLYVKSRTRINTDKQWLFSVLATYLKSKLNEKCVKNESFIISYAICGTTTRCLVYLEPCNHGNKHINVCIE